MQLLRGLKREIKSLGHLYSYPKHKQHNIRIPFTITKLTTITSREEAYKLVITNYKNSKGYIAYID